MNRSKALRDKKGEINALEKFAHGRLLHGSRVSVVYN